MEITTYDAQLSVECGKSFIGMNISRDKESCSCALIQPWGELSSISLLREINGGLPLIVMHPGGITWQMAVGEMHTRFQFVQTLEAAFKRESA